MTSGRSPVRFPRPWTRRQRRVLGYTLLSLAALGASATFVFVREHRARDPVVPGKSVEGLTDVLAREVPDRASIIEFRDVTPESGVDFVHRDAMRSRFLPEDMASGCALEDLDGDGDLDLFFANFEPVDSAKKRPDARRGHALHLNDGSGRFRDVSEEAGVATPVHGMGVAAGDYDSDGDVDLFVTCYDGPDQLFRNRGDATFQDVAGEAFDDVAGESARRPGPKVGPGRPVFHTGAAFADHDGDGDLDLYVGAYVECRYEPDLIGRASSQYGLAIPFTLNPSSYRPAPNILWRNRGDGTFEDVTAAAGVENARGRTLSVAFTDLDGDHLPDIYTANDVSDNAFFRNRGDGTFEDLSYQTHTADYRGAMGLAVGDYDGDLDSDIFVTHWLAQENSLFERMPPAGRPYPTYADVADMQGLGAVSLDWVGWGTFFFDFDADGRADLFVANGNTIERPDDQSELAPQRLALFWNGIPDGFFNVAVKLDREFSRPGDYRGAVAGDIDGDGDLDIVVTTCGGPPRILRNDAPRANRWLIVKAVSRGANRHAVGARVLVEAGDLKLAGTVGAQPSYLSALPLELHFGLGKRDVVDRLTVRFPSGREARLEAVEAGRRIVIEEP